MRMRNSITALFLCLMVVSVFVSKSRCQVVISENPSYITDKPFFEKWLDAEVLDGRKQSTTIKPTEEKLCFDKIIRVKTNTPKGPAAACMFVNTKVGFVGYRELKPGTDASCNLRPDTEDFVLTVYGLKGNVYTYHTIKKKDGFDYYVVTSNTHRFLYRMTSTTGDALLHRKDATRLYCGGKAKAWAYKYDLRPETWYLFGKTVPDAVIFQPTKYLGSFGVGYQYSDKGSFIIMGLDGAGYQAEITGLEDGNWCFDPSRFRIFEDVTYTKGKDDIKKQRDKLLSEQATIRDEECASAKLKVIQHSLQALDRREENLERVLRRSLLLGRRVSTRDLNLFLYPEEILQGWIYDTELKICRTQKRIPESDGSSRERYVRRLTCLQDLLSEQLETEKKLQSISRQYANNPGLAQAEKSKALLTAMRACD